MWTFLASGTLYLLGVAAILVYKPQSMFTPDGNWKEFGIGKREDKYTAFPFWLFCITWALVSYCIVEFILYFQESTEGTEEIPENLYKPNMKRGNVRNGNRRNLAAMKRNYVESTVGEPVELPKGYYVLDDKATHLSGVPKYIYMGPEEP
jgi:hypothetical protein